MTSTLVVIWYFKSICWLWLLPHLSIFRVLLLPLPILLVLTSLRILALWLGFAWDVISSCTTCSCSCCTSTTDCVQQWRLKWPLLFIITLGSWSPFRHIVNQLPANDLSDLNIVLMALVGRGFSQERGIDYFETFSPTLRFASLRTLLTIGANMTWKCIRWMSRQPF